MKYSRTKPNHQPLDMRLQLPLFLIASVLLASCSVFNPAPAPTPMPTFVPPLGATGTPLPTPTPDPADYVMLSPEQLNAEGGYAFQPVLAWTPAGDRLAYESSGTMASMGSNGTGLYLNLNSESAGTNLGSLDCLTMIRGRMAESLQDFSPSEPAQLMTNNIPGHQLSFTASLNGQALQGQLSTFFPKARCISLLGFTQGPQAPQDWQLSGQYAYTKLLSTLRFPDQLLAQSCPVSADPNYAYSPDSPVRVGNTNITDGLQRMESYLKTLRGPAYEPVTYTRLDPLFNAAGEIVDAYSVTYAGLPEPKTLYFEIFSYEAPSAPLGFTCETVFPLSPP